MPYGTMDKATEDILRAADIDPEAILCEQDVEGSAIQVSIMFEGALEESFLIPFGGRAERKAIVDAIFDGIVAQYPDKDVEVSADHVYVGEDFIEGSGYTDESYTQRTSER